MPTPVIDPWLVNADGTPDPFASTVDFGMTTKDEVDPSLLDDEPQTPLNPEVIGNQPPAPSEEDDEPAPVAAPVIEEPTGPEIVELEDGAFVSLEREAKGWKATLDPGTGHAEVFWGNTKNELMVNVLKGKLNATKKIRELNKKVKLTAAPPAQRPADPTPSVRQLTADEVFEIKALWESDPAAALDMLVKKRTNVSLEELVGKAQRGDQANMNLETENTSKEFLARNPDYYPDSENKNFQSLIKWLAKFKLGKTATENNAGDIFTELWQTGNYTVENLEEAFEDLTEDGMMVKPRLPKAPPVEPTPAPAPPTPRIVKTETRPRAALGIGRSDATATPPAAPSAPTDEDLDNLSDTQIKELLGGVRRQRIAARRS